MRPRQAPEEEEEEEETEEETEEEAPCVSMAVKSLSVAKANPCGVTQQRLNNEDK